MKFQFNAAWPDATNEQKWEQIVHWRNEQLFRTDWTQVLDSPVDKVAWAAYRQALRDLPAQCEKADDAELPTAP
jgi:hypothetical protein